jgi:hypothetical protein
LAPQPTSQTSVPGAWDLEGCVGGGYASSLTAQVDGHRTVGLGGWFATAVLGVRFPGLF